MKKLKRKKKAKKNSEKDNQIGAIILEVVEKQLEENDPPESTKTLERLMASGETRENALKLISNALSVEIFDVVNNQKAFNAERYDKNLKSLPDMPWAKS